MPSQTTALSLEDYAHAVMVLMDRYCYIVIGRSSVFFASVRQTINGSPSFVQAENNRLIQDRCRMTSQSQRLGLLRPSVIGSRQRSLSVVSTCTWNLLYRIPCSVPATAIFQLLPASVGLSPRLPDHHLFQDEQHARAGTGRARYDILNVDLS